MAKNTKAFVQDFAFYEQLWEYYSQNRGKIRSRYNDLTKKFLAYNDSNENSDAFLREPQFEALEMYVFIKEFMDNGYVNDFTGERRHHEIYLSDPRKVAPEKCKTVIRHPIKRRKLLGNEIQ